MDPDPGGPKKCGSGGSGVGSTTLITDFYCVPDLQLFRPDPRSVPDQEGPINYGSVSSLV